MNLEPLTTKVTRSLGTSGNSQRRSVLSRKMKRDGQSLINDQQVTKCRSQTSISDILIRSSEMQQYAGVYLLQNYSTYFGCLSHSSSGVHQTVTAASGTGHSVRTTTFRQEGCCSDTMTYTKSCSYSLMYS